MLRRLLRAVSALRSLTKMVLKECACFPFVLCEEPQLDRH